jgi:hypothetical protein
MYDGWTTHEGKFGGMWFMNDSSTRTEVIAPPGVRITFDERCDPFAPGSVRGWRVLRIDDDGASDPSSLVSAEPRPASTREVVDLLGPRWIIEIKRILLGQLEVATSFGRPRDGGPIDDELALASAICTDWLLKELRDTFPDELWERPGKAMTYEDVPHYSDDLLRLIPMPSRHVAMPSIAMRRRVG